MTNFTLAQLQEENKPWIVKNFHEQNTKNAWEPLLGIIEELGELEQAEYDDTVSSNVKSIDACGDTMVFMADYCSCMGFNLYELGERVTKPYFLNTSELVVFIGELCHAHLKYMQNIRLNEKHLEKVQRCLITIISYLKCILEDIDAGTLEEICEKVWGEVKERDWKKNQINGAVGV